MHGQYTSTPTDLAPPKTSFYLIRNDHKELLRYVASRRSQNKITNILVKGPQGCGKSTLPAQVAATEGLPFAVVEMGLNSEASQIFGSLVIEHGETTYVPGLFTRALQTPRCVIHIQEINRPESDKTLNAMFSVLDDQQRSLWVDDAKQRFQVAPGVTFFATLNEGYEFIGTTPLDQALEDRFGIKIQLGYLPAAEECNLLLVRTGLDKDMSHDLVRLANSLRENAQAPMHVSTRNVLEIADLIKFGIPFQDALRATLALDQDRLESVLSAIHFGGMSDADMQSTGSRSYSILA